MELGGQTIGDPDAPQVAEQGQTAQADGEADEQLQNEFQHAPALSWGQPKGRTPGQLFPWWAVGVMLETGPVWRWLPTIPCRP